MSVEQNMKRYQKRSFLAQCERRERVMKLQEGDTVTVHNGPSRGQIGKVVQLGPDRGNSTYAMVQGRDPVPFTAILQIHNLSREVM